jgi:hypothetical protein
MESIIWRAVSLAQSEIVIKHRNCICISRTQDKEWFIFWNINREQNLRVGMVDHSGFGFLSQGLDTIYTNKIRKTKDTMRQFGTHCLMLLVNGRHIPTQAA